MNRIIALAAAAVVLSGCSRPEPSVSVEAGGRVLTATLVGEDIVKVSSLAPGEEDAGLMTVLETNLPEGFEYSVKDSAGVKILRAGNISVRAIPGRGIELSGAGGTILFDNGVRDGAIRLANSGMGSFYGAGERGHRLNLRGDTLVNHNRATYGYGKGDSRISQMNITMPLVSSSDGYALVFDDYASSTLGLTDTITYESEASEPVNYYFIGGASRAALSSRLADLTGHQPLPPLWTLGYTSSRYGYRSAEQLADVIDSLKAAGYPLDGVVLDLYWFGQETDMGYLDWDSVTWPDPEGMAASLAERDINLVTISEPFILTDGNGIANYAHLDSAGMFIRDSLGNTHPVTIWVGSGSMMDVSNPDTRAWLADRYRHYLAQGVNALWGDLGEPEMHPESACHANGKKAFQYHNKYGNDWASIISEIHETDRPGEPYMTLMRAGTTGLQRYGVFPWSGDVSRSWEGMQAQPVILLSAGLSGLGYMGQDVGGFAVEPDKAFNPELYLRWMQMGVFSPMLRTHAQQFAEPYYYTQYAPELLALVRERYAWLPYNYSLAIENNRYGWPLARPLDWEEGLTTAYDAVDDEYLWGSDVLVAPVMNAGATERRVVFPAGSMWYDYNDPNHVYGGHDETVPTPMNVMPLYVRAGAFLPRADYEMNSTADYRPDELTVTYYPFTEESERTLLSDDGALTFRGVEEDARYVIDLSSEADTDYNLKLRIAGTDKTSDVMLPRNSSRQIIINKN